MIFIKICLFAVFDPNVMHITYVIKCWCYTIMVATLDIAYYSYILMRKTNQVIQNGCGCVPVQYPNAFECISYINMLKSEHVVGKVDHLYEGGKFFDDIYTKALNVYNVFKVWKPK